MLQHMFDPRVLLVTAPVFLFSLSLHEFMHAWMADRLGDGTARALGRLTINPLAHYDPIGTTFGLLFRVFGWAKPVPVNPAAFRSPKRDMMLTALGGPMVNLALALCFAVTFKIVFAAAPVPDPESAGSAWKTLDLIQKVAAYGVFLNLALAMFNLIPLYPLDGHHILRGFLSYKAALAYDKTKHLGGYVLMLLLILSFSGHGGLSVLVGTPIRFIMDVTFTDAEFLRFWSVVGKLL